MYIFVYIFIYIHKESYRSPIHFCGRTQPAELAPLAELGTLSCAGDARNTTYVERRTPESIILGRESYWSLDNQHVIYWSSQDGAGYPGYPAQYLMWKMWNMWKMCRVVGPKKNTFGTLPMYVMYDVCVKACQTMLNPKRQKILCNIFSTISDGFSRNSSTWVLPHKRGLDIARRAPEAMF